MTHTQNQDTPMDRMLILLEQDGFGGMSSVLEVLSSELMKLEGQAFLRAAPHERTDDRRGYANGFKGKRVDTRVGRLDLKVPQVRALAEGDDSFYPSALERGVRSERALKLAAAEMSVQGVSTRKVVEITKELCGLDVTSMQVSLAAQALDDELERWRKRELGEVVSLILDARYEKERIDGSMRSCAVLLATGVLSDGKQAVLGTTTSPSEAEVHWRDFLKSPQDREMLSSRGGAGRDLSVSCGRSPKGIEGDLQAVLT